MSDYIKLRRLAAKINAEVKCGPVPVRWDDAMRPRGISRPRWYEDVYKESK